MELNKCQRCGCFFTQPGNTCSKCSEKDVNEQSVLSNFLVNIDEPVSLEEISQNTGISLKNLNRHISTNNFSTNNIKFNGNIGIQL